uniref:NDH dehydrogenase subunit 6 n=1 Tax=Singhiella simplex TaxID=1608328 RepID=A0A7G2CTD2_9HEMI|nr:NDH dehydrogenase subunit 6 [Singhiella simplex]
MTYSEFILGSLVIGLYHPSTLVLSFTLFLTVLSVSLVFMMKSYFYSYMVFMLFVSGVIVMMMYLCGVLSIGRSSLASWVAAWICLVGCVLWALGASAEVGWINPAALFLYCELFDLSKFTWLPFMLIFVVFINYLFFCMIIIYEIVKKCEGPLRMKS